MEERGFAPNGIEENAGKITMVSWRGEGEDAPFISFEGFVVVNKPTTGYVMVLASWPDDDYPFADIIQQVKEKIIQQGWLLVEPVLRDNTMRARTRASRHR